MYLNPVSTICDAIFSSAQYVYSPSVLTHFRVGVADPRRIGAHSGAPKQDGGAAGVGGGARRRDRGAHQPDGAGPRRAGQRHARTRRRQAQESSARREPSWRGEWR
jgi:hypothetical protein